MAKTITGKRVKFELEFYWRGKKRTPSVGFTYAGADYEGLPTDNPAITAAETEFHRAANDLCEQLVLAGELD